MIETIQYIRHVLPLLLESVPLAERPAVPMHSASRMRCPLIFGVFCMIAGNRRQKEIGQIGDASAAIEAVVPLRRAATRPTITYRQLVDGAQINGALPALTG